MVTTTKMDSVLIQGKEKLQQAKDSGKSPITLYDALEIFSLSKFKDFLTESGWIDMLKQRSNITVIAPVNEAFGRIDPLVAAELASAKRMERMQTLARSHIIPASKLVGKPVSELGFEPTLDLNGDIVNLYMEVRRNAGETGNADPKQCILHAINKVMPLEPSPINGSVHVSNGRLILVSDVIVGKSFLEQKYADIRRKFFNDGGETKKYTLWENFTTFGLTQFCKLAEDTGLVSTLQQPHDHATRPWVIAPVDEAFSNLPKRFTKRCLETPAGRERFVKDQMSDEQQFRDRLGAYATYGLAELFSPKSVFTASNGRFVLTLANTDYRIPYWNPTYAPDRVE